MIEAKLLKIKAPTSDTDPFSTSTIFCNWITWQSIHFATLNLFSPHNSEILPFIVIILRIDFQCEFVLKTYSECIS